MYLALVTFLFSAGAVTLAEIGDKTLVTIALTTKFPSDPIGVLLGTTTGMIIADAIGIVAGVVMYKKIPEKIIKLRQECSSSLALSEVTRLH